MNTYILWWELFLSVIYAAGLSITFGLQIYRDRKAMEFNYSYVVLMAAIAAVLWPLYWFAVFGVALWEKRK